MKERLTVGGLLAFLSAGVSDSSPLSSSSSSSLPASSSSSSLPSPDSSSEEAFLPFLAGRPTALPVAFFLATKTVSSVFT